MPISFCLTRKPELSRKLGHHRLIISNESLPFRESEDETPDKIHGLKAVESTESCLGKIVFQQAKANIHATSVLTSSKLKS